MKMKTAAGGLFVSYDQVSDQSAKIRMDAHIRNESGKSFNGELVYELWDREGKQIFTQEKSLSVGKGKARQFSVQTQVENPHLWSPDSPYLYSLRVYVKDKNGHVTDGYSRRIGIRSIEFRGADGLYINGKPFGDKLMGVNRHQDYAYIGNAVPNNLHWLDVKKMRDAGFRIIRSAHYPQDPAFMDACDELGMFIIVATPGWQYWIRNRCLKNVSFPTSVIWSVETVIIRLSFCGNRYLMRRLFRSLSHRMPIGLLMKSIRLRVAMLPLMTRAKEQWI